MSCTTDPRTPKRPRVDQEDPSSSGPDDIPGGGESESLELGAALLAMRNCGSTMEMKYHTCIQTRHVQELQGPPGSTVTDIWGHVRCGELELRCARWRRGDSERARPGGLPGGLEGSPPCSRSVLSFQSVSGGAYNVSD